MGRPTSGSATGPSAWREIVLAESGVTSLAKLRQQSPLRLEALLNRKPGFGYEVLGLANAIPQYEICIKEIGLLTDEGKSDVQAEIGIECKALSSDVHKASKKTKSRSFDMTSILTLSSDMEFIDFRRIQTKSLKNGKTFTINVSFKKPSQSTIVIVSSEIYAGTASQAAYKPNVKPEEFPIRKTKPCTALELDLAGLEDDPDFWNMDIDSNGDEPQGEPPKEAALGKRERSEGAKSSPAPKSAVIRASQLRLLPNGAYECNHPCKDKTACRHYCCKHGLERPRLSSKAAKGKEKLHDHKQGRGEVKPTSKVQRLHKNVVQKLDKRFQDLEKRHDNANTTEYQRLPAGQRLNIQSPEALQDKSRGAKSRVKPTFNLALADIGETKEPTHDRLDLEELDDDDEDDLPDTILEDLEIKKRSTQSETAKRALSIGLDENDERFPTTPIAKRRKTDDWEDRRDVATTGQSQSPAPLFLPSAKFEVSDIEVPAEQLEVSANHDFEFDVDFGRQSPDLVQNHSKASETEMPLESQGSAIHSFLGSQPAAALSNAGTETHTVPPDTGTTNVDLVEEIEEWLFGADVEIV